jgi:hypothetical protein
MLASHFHDCLRHRSNYRCKNKWFEIKVKWKKKDFNLGTDGISASWGRGNLVIFHLWIKEKNGVGRKHTKYLLQKLIKKFKLFYLQYYRAVHRNVYKQLKYKFVGRLYFCAPGTAICRYIIHAFTFVVHSILIFA